MQFFGVPTNFLATATLPAGTLTASAPFTLTQTWNNAGVTFNAFLLNVTNTASNSASTLAEFQVGGALRFRVRNDGGLDVAAGGFYRFNGRSQFRCAADGNLQLGNNANSDFGLLQIGGTSASFPAWKRSTTEMQARLADDSADSPISASRVRTPKSAELTIATGAITVTGSYHDVDTEADGATDDLDTISGGVDGQILTIRANNDARTVVVKDGTGNLQIAGDMTLDNTQDTITLRFDNALSAWLEIGRAASGA